MIEVLLFVIAALLAGFGLGYVAANVKRDRTSSWWGS